MKNFGLFLILIFVFSTLVQAEMLDTFTGREFDIQWSGKGFNKEVTNQIILQNSNKKLQLQALLDQAGTGSELLWRVNGALDEAYKQIQGSNISWIWANATSGKVSLRVILNPDGSGHIELYQDGNLVGYTRCQSSAIRNKSGGQPNEGKTKIWKKSADYVNADGVKMPNALFIDDPDRKLALHAGNRLTKSGGCVRMGIFSSRQLYELMVDGAEVVVMWN